MITEAAIIAFLTTFLSLFIIGGIERWNNLNDTDKASHTSNLTTLVNQVIREIKPESEEKVTPPDDFEGDPDQVSGWCRRMENYFDQKRITSDWIRITQTLMKIKKGKGNIAQRWADTYMERLIAFNKERQTWKDEHNGLEPSYEEVHGNTETGVSSFTITPPFPSWNQLATDLQAFFVSPETQSNAIAQIGKLRQNKRPVEEYILEFNAWENLTGFNNTALVDKFKSGVNPGLGKRLVEVAGLKDDSSINDWKNKAVIFERQKRESDARFGTTGNYQTTGNN